MSKGTRRLIPARSVTGLFFVLVLSGVLVTAGACEDLTSGVSTSEDTAAATTTTTSTAPADVAETPTTEESATDTTSGSASSTPSTSDSTTSTTFEPFVMVVTTSVSSLWTSFKYTDSRLDYDGGWVEIVGSGGPGESVRATNSSAKVEMEFLGLRIALVSVTGPAMGKAKLTLDGGSPFYVDLYDPVGGLDTVWTSGTLGPGSHTLKIEWSGLKHPSSLNTAINIRDVEVQGTLL